MDLPMTRDQAHGFVGWIKDNYRDQIQGVLSGSPFTLDMACGIACQESGIYLLGFSHRLSPDDALARCVFDASGDSAGTSRGAFPQNTAAFRQAMGDELADMLIAEANATRALRGLPAEQWVYKGYGIFQYDLQNIKGDGAFFREKGWGRFDQCLSRLLAVLMRKYAATNDPFQSIRAYNGSGKAADNYLANVRQFVTFAAEVP